MRASWISAGTLLLAYSVPALFADESQPTGAVAHGLRAENGLEMWHEELECLGGGVQTPTTGTKVCQDASGRYTMCSSAGECAAISCCTLVLRIPSLTPATKGDCLSCTPPLPGTCAPAVTPAAGAGPIQATAACD